MPKVTRQETAVAYRSGEVSVLQDTDSEGYSEFTLLWGNEMVPFSGSMITQIPNVIALLKEIYDTTEVTD